jgi:hypothetical protein
MRWTYWVAGLAALGLGMYLLARTGETVWGSQLHRGHTVMIYLGLLFVLYPLIGFITARRR